MIHIPTDAQKKRFAELCAAHSYTEIRGGDSLDGIGTYNEKRTHRVIKEFVSSDPSTYEIRVGRAVADVYADGVITEIQTGSLYPLTKKVAAYLEVPDVRVRIIYPVISKRRFVRVDPISGEVIRARMSPKKETDRKILPELIYLSDFLGDERLSIEIYSLAAEEHRYSDEVHRYRKSGKYDREIFPTELIFVTELSTKQDILSLLPEELLGLDEFTAAQFMRATGIRGRRAYNALNALVNARVLGKTDTRPAIFKFPFDE